MTEAIATSNLSFSSATTSEAKQKASTKKSTDLINRGEDLILNLNNSDAQVFDFMKKAMSADDTSPNAIAMLQHFLQKRMEKVSLITNMIKMFGDAAMRVLSNLGR